jgi:NAD-dependent deacetylase
MNIVFLTGAGIDKESGVNTFRDLDGLWEGYDVEKVATLNGWKKDKKLVLDFYNERKNQLKTIKPNNAHKLIAKLEKDHDVTIITQNVTNLQERAGSSNVIHLHGDLTLMCSSIDKNKTLSYVDDIKVGDMHDDGSQLRPFIVWFGEDVPMMSKAMRIVSKADIVVVVGTSFNVYPAGYLITYAKKSAKKYYIDPNPAILDDESIVIISEVATKGVKKLIKLLK